VFRKRQLRTNIVISGYKVTGNFRHYPAIDKAINK
jgi:hypothetical protein